jgi:hypothetical protein
VSVSNQSVASNVENKSFCFQSFIIVIKMYPQKSSR